MKFLEKYIRNSGINCTYMEIKIAKNEYYGEKFNGMKTDMK